MPFGVKDVGVGLHEGQDDRAILQVDVGQVFVHSFWDACALQEPCSLLFRPVVRKTAHLSSSAPGAGSINSFLQNFHFLVLCRFLLSGMPGMVPRLLPLTGLGQRDAAGSTTMSNPGALAWQPLDCACPQLSHQATPQTHLASLYQNMG